MTKASGAKGKKRPSKEDYDRLQEYAPPHSLMGVCCAEPGVVCLSCVCPCVAMATNAELLAALETPADRGTVTLQCLPEGSRGAAIYCATFPCCYALLGGTYRDMIFKKKLHRQSRTGVEGLCQNAADCLAHCCCFPCAFTQERLVLKARKLTPKAPASARMNRA